MKKDIGSKTGIALAVINVAVLIIATVAVIWGTISLLFFK